MNTIYVRRNGLVLLLLVVMALLLAACGAETAANEDAGNAEHEDGTHMDENDEATHMDDHDEGTHMDDHEGEGGQIHMSDAPIAGAEEIRIVAKEWGYEPASIHLHEGEAVNITLVNEGALEHEFVLEEFDFHIHTEIGKTVTAGFVPDKTGTFEFACFLPGHYDAGMVGEALVEDSH